MGLPPSGGAALRSVKCGTPEQIAMGFLLALSLCRWVTLFLSLNSSIYKMGTFKLPWGPW